MIGLLEEHTELAAIGGAVECGSTTPNRAVYYCDFGRYQNPVPEGRRHFVSDANVVYRREALDEIRGDWGGDYHEYSVHQRFVERGRPIWLTPRTVAWQNRGDLTVVEALGNGMSGVDRSRRSAWRGSPLGKRLAFACLSPVLPVILTPEADSKSIHTQAAPRGFPRGVAACHRVDNGLVVGRVRGLCYWPASFDLRRLPSALPSEMMCLFRCRMSHNGTHTSQSE